MAPEAPALFSTMTDVCHMSPSFWPMTRARMSVPPPGAKPTMMRTGPAGSACARSVGMAMVAAAPAMKVLRCIVSLTPWIEQKKGARVAAPAFQLRCLLQRQLHRMPGEIVHGRGDAGARELHARQLQAHL